MREGTEEERKRGTDEQMNKEQRKWGRLRQEVFLLEVNRSGLRNKLTADGKSTTCGSG
jgi:hypothetical protein